MVKFDQHPMFEELVGMVHNPVLKGGNSKKKRPRQSKKVPVSGCSAPSVLSLTSKQRRYSFSASPNCPSVVLGRNQHALAKKDMVYPKSSFYLVIFPWNCQKFSGYDLVSDTPTMAIENCPCWLPSWKSWKWSSNMPQLKAGSMF